MCDTALNRMLGPEAVDFFDPEAERRFVAAVLSGRMEARARLETRIRCVPRMLTAINARRGRPLGEHDLADLAQDTLVIALRKLPEFEPIAPFEGWLYRVCCYEFLNALRRRERRRHELPTGGDVETLAAAGTPDPYRFDHVHLALERLGGLEADVIWLKHFVGLTFAEITTQLGARESTVKTRYYRGRRKLKELLA